MQELQQGGKIKQIGVSNFTPSLLKEVFQYAEIFCNQIEYHPYLSQRSLLDMSLEHDFCLLPMRRLHMEK
jgi:diketogulonate reductase-like aldo/keto reductase